MFFVDKKMISFKEKGELLTGPFFLASTFTQCVVALSRPTTDETDWPATTTIAIAGEISFDNGNNWVSLGGGTISGGILPLQGRDNTESSLCWTPLGLVCATCGELYLPGDRRYENSLLHSEVSLKPGIVLAEVQTAIDRQYGASPRITNLKDMQLKALWREETLLSRQFHTPSPSLSAAVRQIKISLIADGPMSALLDIEGL